MAKRPLPAKYDKVAIRIPGTLKEVVSGKERTIRHLISAQIIDRDKEVLRSKGIKADLYLEANPVVFLNHRAGELPIGRSLSVTPYDTEIEAVTQFAGLDQLHEQAERCWLLYRDGFMHSWSVGFDTIKATRDALVAGQTGRSVLDWELLEYSAVGIPSNPAAVTRMLEELRDDLPDGA